MPIHKRNKARNSRRRANGPLQFVRYWLRHNGRVVRLLTFDDYSACESGGEPRWFVKLLNHKRFAAGTPVPQQDVEWFSNTLLPALQHGQWTEVVFA